MGVQRTNNSKDRWSPYEYAKVGAGLAGLGALGYAAYNYPKLTQKLGQKALRLGFEAAQNYSVGGEESLKKYAKEAALRGLAGGTGATITLNPLFIK